MVDQSAILITTNDQQRNTIQIAPQLISPEAARAVSPVKFRITIAEDSSLINILPGTLQPFDNQN